MSPTPFLPGLLNNVEETGAHMAKIDVHLCMQEDCFVHSYGKLARLMIDNFAVSENVHGASGGSALIRQHHRSTMTCPAGFMSPRKRCDLVTCPCQEVASSSGADAELSTREPEET